MNKNALIEPGCLFEQSLPEFRFTVFIPSFNRAKTIADTLKSLEGSRFRDFEAIIVDDGSTDRTWNAVARLRRDISFPLTYVYQRNSGKAGAHNAALLLARGEFFITLDAGDLMLPEAMTSLVEAWKEIPEDEKQYFAGVSALCLKEDGTISGDRYPDALDQSFLQLVSSTPLSGEKRQAILTEVLREFPYPRIPGEKHIRPDLILRRMAHRYRLRLLNVPVQVNVREPDGITARIHRYRMENPGGFRLFYLEEITLNREYYTWRKSFGDHWRYVRFSMHAGVGLSSQAKEVPDRFLWLVAVPKGIFRWLLDLLERRPR